MGKDDWESVCNNLHLSNGKFFPLPITLPVKKNTLKVGDVVQLVDSTNYPIATMEISELYKPDIDFECKHAYGSTDPNHP